MLGSHGSTALRLQRRIGGYVLVLPALVLYVLFVLLPLFRTFQLSFTDWDGLRKKLSVVGLDNYIQLAGDERFLDALGRNLTWVVGSWLPQGLGLGLAALLSAEWLRGRTFFRTVYFIPHTMSLVVVGIVWGLIYNPIWGPLNEALRAIGLDALARGWLADPVAALPSVITAANWTYYGFALVIFLAGLQDIDHNLYDAASVDGANSWQKFRHVTLPGLSNQITLLLAVSFINTLRHFDLVYVMTSGGPGNATEVAGYYVYTLALFTRQVGYGSAVAIGLTAIIFVASVVFIRLRERVG